MTAAVSLIRFRIRITCFGIIEFNISWWLISSDGSVVSVSSLLTDLNVAGERFIFQYIEWSDVILFHDGKSLRYYSSDYL